MTTRQLTCHAAAHLAEINKRVSLYTLRQLRHPSARAEHRHSVHPGAALSRQARKDQAREGIADWRRMVPPILVQSAKRGHAEIVRREERRDDFDGVNSLHEPAFPSNMRAPRGN